MLRSILLTTLALLVFHASTRGNNSVDQEAPVGHTPFAAFLDVMAPAWHTAWPDRNLAALIAAGPKFVEQFKAIKQMNPKLVSPTRRPAFIEQRERFAALVESYSAACGQHDSDLVYQLLPDLHNAFESTATTLTPVNFPELVDLMVTIDSIVQTHLPDRDLQALVVSTETLRNKMDILITAPLPETLKPNEDRIRPSLETLRHLVLHMLQAMYQNDIKMYIIYTTELKTQSDEFIYLNL